MRFLFFSLILSLHLNGMNAQLGNIQPTHQLRFPLANDANDFLRNIQYFSYKGKQYVYFMGLVNRRLYKYEINGKEVKLISKLVFEKQKQLVGYCP